MPFNGLALVLLTACAWTRSVSPSWRYCKQIIDFSKRTMPTEVTGPEEEHPTSTTSGVVEPPQYERVSPNTICGKTSRWSTYFPIQLILRMDRSAAKVVACGSCHRRPLCKCVHDNHRKARALEETFWVVLAVSAAVTVLLALICSRF